jgi:hypothetical protein
VTDTACWNVCVRRCDIYAAASHRWADPRAGLLHGDEWTRARTGAAVRLGHDLDPRRELAALRRS